jgi:hypothetical protein
MTRDHAPDAAPGGHVCPCDPTDRSAAARAVLANEPEAEFLETDNAGNVIWEWRGITKGQAEKILCRAIDAERARYAALVEAAQVAVRDAGTEKWPVNLDRMRMALYDLGALPEAAS